VGLLFSTFDGIVFDSDSLIIMVTSGTATSLLVLLANLLLGNVKEQTPEICLADGEHDGDALENTNAFPLCCTAAIQIARILSFTCSNASVQQSGNFLNPHLVRQTGYCQGQHLLPNSYFVTRVIMSTFSVPFF